MTEEGATPVSLYAVLGVASDASDAELRSAYRSLARVLHPDASAAPVDAQERMAAVNEAYATLADPALRAAYDGSLRGVRSVSVSTAGRGRGTGAGATDEGFGDEEQARDSLDRDDGSSGPSSPLSAAVAVCAALGGIGLGLGFALFSGGLALFGALLLVLSGALSALRFRQAMRSGRAVSRH